VVDDRQGKFSVRCNEGIVLEVILLYTISCIIVNFFFSGLGGDHGLNILALLAQLSPNYVQFSLPTIVPDLLAFVNGLVTAR
jgi:hypothetical protein